MGKDITKELVYSKFEHYADARAIAKVSRRIEQIEDQLESDEGE